MSKEREREEREGKRWLKSANHLLEGWNSFFFLSLSRKARRWLNYSRPHARSDPGRVSHLSPQSDARYCVLAYEVVSGTERKNTR